MSENRFSVRHTDDFPGRSKSFEIDKYFSQENREVTFGQNGANFDKWFGGAVIPSEKSCTITSWELQEPAKEADFVRALGGSIYPVSLVAIYDLLLKGSSVLGKLNIFFCISPKTKETHLLSLFLNSRLWYIHGYTEPVRDNRDWRIKGRVITQKPL